MSQFLCIFSKAKGGAISNRFKFKRKLIVVQHQMIISHVLFEAPLKVGGRSRQVRQEGQVSNRSKNRENFIGGKILMILHIIRWVRKW